MRVLIMGAGSLGKCVAGLLMGQASIIVYERNLVTRQTLMKGWFVLEERKRRQKVDIRAVSSLDKLQGEIIDILIFATKVMDLQVAISQAAHLDPRCVFLPQNGIFDVRWVKRSFKKAHICRGVTTMACQEKGPGQVTLFYRGNMYLGGDGAKLVADLFRKAGVGTKAYRNPQGCVWAKLIFSSVMNPLPVVTGQGYEVLRKDKDIWKLVKRAIKEGRAVAKAMGVRLTFDPMKLIDRVRNGDLTGISHQGSIIHDLRIGRTTELEYITGALILYARKKRIKTPALDTIVSRAQLAGA